MDIVRKPQNSGLGFQKLDGKAIAGTEFYARGFEHSLKIKPI